MCVQEINWSFTVVSHRFKRWFQHWLQRWFPLCSQRWFQWWFPLQSGEAPSGLSPDHHLQGRLATFKTSTPDFLVSSTLLENICLLLYGRQQINHIIRWDALCWMYSSCVWTRHTSWGSSLAMDRWLTLRLLLKMGNVDDDDDVWTFLS